jgi:putative oxidoreductase
MVRLVQSIARGYAKFADCLNWLQPVVLLVIRVYIGCMLFISGSAKIQHIEATTNYFKGLHIPMPLVNAYASGIVESAGGVLLVAGFLARLAAIPLIANMLVAYATAHPAEFKAIVSDPGRFLKAPPFLYLLTAIIILAFGPGLISVDAMLRPKPQVVEDDDRR